MIKRRFKIAEVEYDTVVSEKGRFKQQSFKAKLLNCGNYDKLVIMLRKRHKGEMININKYCIYEESREISDWNFYRSSSCLDRNHIEGEKPEDQGADQEINIPLSKKERCAKKK